MKRIGMFLMLGGLVAACAGPEDEVPPLPSQVTQAQGVGATVSFFLQTPSNDWWMEARVAASPLPERVEVSVEGGPWTALAQAPWDTEVWSLGQFFKDKRVRLRAVRGAASATTCEVRFQPGVLLPPCAAEGSYAASTGYLHTVGTRLYASNGQPVRLTGLNWFGFEGTSRVPYGLDKRTLGALLDQVKALGYNMLRLPYANEMLRPGMFPDPVFLSETLNPGLRGLTSLQVMDRIIAEARSRGLRVVLDRHRPDPSSQTELWYRNSRVPEEQAWIDDWRMLASRYQGDGTVVGMDLHNEPHGRATWGDGNLETDWRLAAERAGNAILAINPDLLIFVEGVEFYRGSAYWWGGNLRGARDFPVRLAVEGRLVYSTHDYPASVSLQPWFEHPDCTGYPGNLPEVWDAAWGFLVKENRAPVWLGEFGSKLETGPDQQWLQALAGYLGGHQVGFAFWSLNPNSWDTGGLLQDDWTTVWGAKHAVLAPLLAPPLP